MMVAFTIVEINYLIISQFWDLVRPLIFVFALFSSLAALFALFPT